MKSKRSYLIELNSFDTRVQSGKKEGSLSVVENTPFDIKRVYWITGMEENDTRGNHAHHQTEQIAICLNGSCKVKMDDGKKQEEVILNKPNQALYTDTYVWMAFSEFKDSPTILVLASTKHSEDDVIRDYEEFKSCIDE